MRSLLFAAILVVTMVPVPAAQGAGKLSPRVEDYLASSSGDAVKVWVYFSDRGTPAGESASPSVDRALVGERSLERRARRSNGPLVDERDLPLNAPYLRALEDAGCEIVVASRYLNAASAWATPDGILAARDLPFVRKIDRVQTARRDIPEKIMDRPLDERRGEGPRGAPAVDYGTSYTQLDLMNAIPLHDANLHGEGVLVAMLDTGYNRGHESLIHLDIIAERDFINNDPVTENQPGDPANQHNHGTYTLSALGGYAPGNLVGPAWAATFAIGKTERVDAEIQQEEDYYVAGLEWADSLGADIVSTSLGYYDWYTYEDMDGNTAVTTIAADIAAAKGIAVITAAGNNGPLPWPGIIAPSDGDSVIAVGAVDASGIIASFSSRGPTWDNRIKPDVCAMGVMVYSASPADSLSYVWVNGTSLSTPLVAGAAALCLQMHPYWTPVQLRDELRAHASRAAFPDNDYGWGVIDAYQTALFGATGIAGEGAASVPDVVVSQNAPNPFIPSISGETLIRFRVGPDSPDARAGAAGGARDVAVAIYDVSGRLVRRLLDGPRAPGEHTAAWDGRDDRGIAVATGVYYYRVSVGAAAAGKKIVLIRR